MRMSLDLAQFAVNVAVTLSVAVTVSTVADASDVRRSALPPSLQGTWAASAQACDGPDDGKIVVSAKSYVRAGAKCDIFWITVTAAPKGANYSAHGRCVDQATGKAAPPTNLLFRASDGDHISVGSAIGSLAPQQRCR